MGWKSALGVFPPVLFFVLLLSSADAFFHHKKAVQGIPSDYFEELGISRPEKKTFAPDFTLESLSGKPWRLQGARGKVVFLNFWATWCVPCREEMPTMESLHRDFRHQGFEVVAVNFRESKDVVQKFFAELGLTFTALLDTDGTVSQEYGAWSIPLTYIINRKGEFVGKVIGYRKWDGLETRALFRDLLDEKP